MGSRSRRAVVDSASASTISAITASLKLPAVRTGAPSAGPIAGNCARKQIQYAGVEHCAAMAATASRAAREYAIRAVSGKVPAQGAHGDCQSAHIENRAAASTGPAVGETTIAKTRYVAAEGTGFDGQRAGIVNASAISPGATYAAT